MHFFGMEASSVQLRVGAPVWWPCASTAVEPPLRQVSYARCAQGSTGDCDHLGLLAEALPTSFVRKSCRGSTGGRLHLLCSRSPTSRDATSRASPVQVRILPRAPFRPASIKVMQRTFNPLNRERYPGGPRLPGRLIVGHRPLKATMVVRIHPRQPAFALRATARQANFRPMVKQDHVSPTKRR